jgi:hypothetical protein
VLSFLALNPRLFFSTLPDDRRGIGRLITVHGERLGNIAPFLVDAGLGDQEEAARLAAAIAAAGADATPLSKMNQSDLLALLTAARLTGFWGYIVAIDFSRRYVSQWEPQELTSCLQPLIELMPTLAEANVILKIGIPQDASLFEVDAAVTRVQLGPWPPKFLKQMTNVRLAWATGQGGGSLTQLFGPDRPRDVVNELVVASAGSPQQLVRLGNALLARYGEKGEQLTARDLVEIIKRHTEPQTTWQTELRQKMVSSFNEDELGNLCVDLRLDYENLQGGNKAAKARHLIATLERRKRLPELIARCRQLRPNVAWDLPPAALEPPC